MKLRYLSVLLCAFLFAACNKDEETASPASTTNSDTVTKVTTNGQWDSWSGSEPLSMLIEGYRFVATDSPSFYRDSLGVVYLYAHKQVDPDYPHDTLVEISFPGAAKTQIANSQYNAPENAQIKYARVYKDDPKNDMVCGTQWGGNARIRITDISTSHVEGKFYGTLKTERSFTDKRIPNSIEVTAGYFRYSLSRNSRLYR